MAHWTRQPENLKMNGNLLRPKRNREMTGNFYVDQELYLFFNKQP